LVAQMLETRGDPCALIGTLGMRLGPKRRGSERTTPEAPELQEFLRECVEAGAQHAAMEVSSIGVDLWRSHGLKFRGAAFTNLTQDHLDYHGTLAEYKRAKFRLFLEQELGSAVVNVEDPAGVELAARLRAERPEVAVLTVSQGPGADLTLRDLRQGPGGQEGLLCHAGRAEPFQVPLLGRFNLSNYLCAAGLLLADGEPLEFVAGAAQACRGAAGRFERVPIAAPFTVVVDYAHSPDALENVLCAARPLTPGKLVVVFGAGGDRDRAKRPLMGRVVERLADAMVLTSDNPRSEDPQAILADIAAGMKGGAAMTTLSDRREAIVWALENAGAGDMILIAGKGDENYQEIQGVKRPFEDRKVVVEWWEQRK
ncbi:MAG: UDP-N-acetylmuramoyl-L-alanyl-D-glutamate--2,6-diaminopimelate ligase, partial [Deltaproteobacteria bacterium]|nr:UDP-N-acetylmuramoyl-L-alanyl-D-glutamate--2,6-diaminopimelate ligase [Deltaproteobacteria bacterium]